MNSCHDISTVCLSLSHFPDSTSSSSQSSKPVPFSMSVRPALMNLVWKEDAKASTARSRMPRASSC